MDVDAKNQIWFPHRLALVGEVGELAECFQWKSEVARGLPAFSESEKIHVGEELADVLIYTVRLADVCGISLGECVPRKIDMNARKYPADKVLMIGDAPGDHKAAKANGVLFYPILPGREEASWERLHSEALGRFFDGNYAGDYEASLFAEFDASLPEHPSW